ncbi:lipoyl synthase [Dysgonomonas sp. 511]|uniref:lipoyl synthase n=1 Tax=Dysgonomonas sp. 511 TaxID=2302930 RepID=UPI0013D8D9B2|nr:lipoyl synthase [Dysgonomonas sp. 511]NDV79341.1 lipoyl synthase [Dysgonomonas sp. 511]
MAHIKKPEWLKVKLGGEGGYSHTHNILESHGLHTICSSGRCPNQGECWGRGTATFMIGGDICTRSCKFCNTKTGKPLPLDTDEPMKVAESVKLMELKHAVVTSVDRDDLPDMGALHWVATINKIREVNPATTIEVLIPDFQGKPELVDMVCAAAPEVISHNMETVRRLTPQVRSAARYDVSLSVLARIAANGCKAKSGIMLGLGETTDEILETMDDLLSANCLVLTMGQYLQPTRRHLPVEAYIHPDEFSRLKEIALSKGFSHVESGPLVRSSYHAENCLGNR